MFKIFNSEGSTNTPQPASLLSDRHLGLLNFGNTCYCNAVLQSLYFCKPFRDRIFTTGVYNSDVLLRLQQAKDQSELQRESSVGESSQMTRSLKIDTSKSLLSPQQQTSPKTASLLSPQSLYNNIVKPLANIITQQSTQSVTLLSALKDLFVLIHNTKNSTVSPNVPPPISPNNQTASSNQSLTLINGSLVGEQKQQLKPAIVGKQKAVSPKDFIHHLRQVNEQFRAPIHHDAHEFFNYLINNIAEVLQKQNADLQKLQGDNSLDQPTEKTWIHKLFEGELVNETKCLHCECATYRSEPFLDLSLEIPSNHTSITHALKAFTAPEYMSGRNKFFCDACGALQEAEKRMLIKRLPRILVICLKRFKYVEQYGGYIKLQNRVSFPLQMRMSNAMAQSQSPTSQSQSPEDESDPNQLYQLFSIVIHLGNGANYGHYISVIRSAGRWWVYDDTVVESVDEDQLAQLFGAGIIDTSMQSNGNADSSGQQQDQQNSQLNFEKEIDDCRAGYGFMSGVPRSSLSAEGAYSQHQDFNSSNHERSTFSQRILGGWSMSGSGGSKSDTGASCLPHGTAYMLFYEAIR
ncbi:hypothetical protein MIR68_000799 [Amoeboaphelidium protococcarum]|nr:hypothetical protein MIR68_000799 [Amoeboaphelidium protococcarum]